MQKLLSIFTILSLFAAVFLTGCSSVVNDPKAEHSISVDKLQDSIYLTQVEKEWLNHHKEVRVRIGQWPPFMITHGAISGISIDYLKIIAEVHGLKLTYLTEKDISWPETLKQIEKKETVDLIPVIQPTVERRKFMVFSRVYQSLPWVIITRNDADFVGSLADLNGKKVSIQNRFILHRTLEKLYPSMDLKVIKTANPTLDSLKSVATGKAQATINALPVAIYFINKYGLSNLRIAAPTSLDDLSLAMGVRKDWPELASIISKTISAMSRQDIAAINNDWLSMQYKIGLSPRKVAIWAGLAGLAALIGFIVFYTINLTLKKKVQDHTAKLSKELQDRINAEKALQESESRFRTLVENCPLPMALEDDRGTLKYFNPCFVNTFGYTLKDFPTLEVGFLHSYPDPEYRAEVVEKWGQAVKVAQKTGNIIRRDDIRFTCRDGRELSIDIIGMHIGTDIMTVFIDQTGKKQAARIMMQSEKMMSVGGLAAGMAHEINNPLGIILSSVQNMKRRMDPQNPRTRRKADEYGIAMEAMNRYFDETGTLKYLDYIHEAAERAGTIVHNMLDFSRKNDDKQALCSLNKLLDRAVALASSDFDLKKQYDFKTVKIVREYNPDIHSVSVVRNEIEQVFLNLLKNSAQAISTRKDLSHTGKITLRTYEDNRWITAEISDNGPGMSKQQQKRAFEPFFTTKAPGEGTGLGLSVSYFIITRNHNGRIEIQSTPDQETTFIIKLPRS